MGRRRLDEADAWLLIRDYARRIQEMALERVRNEMLDGEESRGQAVNVEAICNRELRRLRGDDIPGAKPEL